MVMVLVLLGLAIIMEVRHVLQHLVSLSALLGKLVVDSLKLFPQEEAVELPEDQRELILWVKIAMHHLVVLDMEEMVTIKILTAVLGSYDYFLFFS